jgi:hypothetical protein
MGIATAELSPIEQTALLTEYARALDSQWSVPILGDALAYDVVGEIDYDFVGLGVPASVVCQTALRAKMLDDRVRAFIADHPDAVVGTSAPAWTAASIVSTHLDRSTGTALTCPGSSRSGTRRSRLTRTHILYR